MEYERCRLGVVRCRRRFRRRRQRRQRQQRRSRAGLLFRGHMCLVPRFCARGHTCVPAGTPWAHTPTFVGNFGKSLTICWIHMQWGMLRVPFDRLILLYRRHKLEFRVRRLVMRVLVRARTRARGPSTRSPRCARTPNHVSQIDFHVHLPRVPNHAGCVSVLLSSLQR